MFLGKSLDLWYMFIKFFDHATEEWLFEGVSKCQYWQGNTCWQAEGSGDSDSVECSEEVLGAGW